MLKIHVDSRAVIRQPDSSRVCPDTQPVVQETPDPAGQVPACLLLRVFPLHPLPAIAAKAG